MEDHGSSHALLQSSPAAGTAGTTLAYAWGYQHQQQHPSAPFDEHHVDTGFGDDDHQQLDLTTAPELRRALVRALAELHASRAAHQAELRRMESEAARLAALVSSAAAERDELRRHCHSLLLLLHHQSQAVVAPPPPPTPSLHAASGFLSAGGVGGGCTTTAAAVTMNNEMNAPDAAACADETELEMALARRLPEKGRLVEAVVSAGPLLQTLLLAGPLPRWRHPPPPAPADIPPFNPGRRHNSPLKADGASNSLSSASAGSSSPESNCSGGPPPPMAHALPSFHMSPSFCM